MYVVSDIYNARNDFIKTTVLQAVHVVQLNYLLVRVCLDTLVVALLHRCSCCLDQVKGSDKHKRLI